MTGFQNIWAGPWTVGPEYIKGFRPIPFHLCVCNVGEKRKLEGGDFEEERLGFRFLVLILKVLLRDRIRYVYLSLFLCIFSFEGFHHLHG